MRKTSGELAKTLHALRLMKLSLEQFAIGFGLEAHAFGFLLLALAYDAIGRGFETHT